MSEASKRAALFGLVGGAVAVVATVALLGIDALYRGDPQSFRLVAEDPFGDGSLILADPDVHSHGTAYRYGRILFPLLGWVLSAITTLDVTVTLPVVSIFALALTGAAAGWLVERRDVDPERAMLVLCVPTLWSSAALGYAEPLAVAFVLAAMAAARHERWSWFALLFALALFTREAFVVALVPFAWTQLRTTGFTATAMRLVPGVVVYGGWLVWVYERTGLWSFLDPSTSRTDAVGPPVLSYVEAVRDGNGAVAPLIGSTLVAVLALAGVVVAARLVPAAWHQDREVALAFAFAVALGLLVGPQGYRFSGDGLRVLLPGHLLLVVLLVRNPGLWNAHKRTNEPGVAAASR